MLTIYGIKNCDTVKKALKWLDTNGIEYQYHDLRVDGINKNRTSLWLSTVPLFSLVNKRSTTWRTLDEKTREGLNEKTAVQLLVDHPTLIKRPVLETGDALYTGFSEKLYQKVLL